MNKYVRIMVWGWNETFNIWRDREKFIRYDHKRGIEYLALEPNYSTRYPKLFENWLPKKAMRLRSLFIFFSIYRRRI